MKRDIYLLRHGQTTQPGTFTGVTDVSLSLTGKAQIQRISPLLEKARIEHCFCSPLARCMETVRLLKLTCGVTVDDTLKEINFGLWEGLNFDQITQRYPNETKLWNEQKEAFFFPGGEQIHQFNGRIHQWFDELLNTGHNRVLVVAHGGVLREGLKALLGIGRGDAFVLNFAEGAVSRITIREGYPNLECFNCRG